MSLWSIVIWLLVSVSQFARVEAESSPKPLVDSLSNNTLLWGPYRPNVYFGVRPRIPRSLLMGLIWGNVDDYQKAQRSM